MRGKGIEEKLLQHNVSQKTLFSWLDTLGNYSGVQTIILPNINTVPPKEE